jgi:predicted NBD/HSP70 family sugar kinase
MTQYYVGVDLHKTVAQVCVTDADGQVLADQRVQLDGRGGIRSQGA